MIKFISLLSGLTIIIVLTTSIGIINCKEKRTTKETIWNCTGYCCVVIHPSHDVVLCENTTLSNVTILENADDVLYENIKPLKFPTLEDTSFSDHYRENVRYFSWKRSNITILLHIPLKDVSFIDFSYNRIQTIDTDAFNVSEKLKEINLSNNDIETLPGKLFYKNPLITMVNLTCNKLHTVPDELLFPLSKLYTLDLSHNSIVLVTKTPLSFNVELREIFLNSNSIQQIHENVFEDKELLIKIDLQDNFIIDIPRYLFSNLFLLKSLNLSRNRIASLFYVLLEDLKNLEYLNLSSNPFQKLRDDFFQNLFKLKKLHISHTLLQVFQKSLLQNLNNLDTLILTKNPNLTEISYDTFEDKFALRNIDLSYNRLSSFPISLSTLFPYRFNITGNPLQCNCTLQWYVIWKEQKYKNRGGDNIDTLKCDGIDHQNETYIKEMLLNMKCPPVMAYITPKNYYELEGSAMLECRVYGVPRPSISWSTPSGIVFHRIENSDDLTYASHPPVHDANMAPVKSDRVKAIGEYTFSLLTSDIQREDGGKYTCFAKNQVQMSKSVTYVYIKTDTMAKIKINSFYAGLSWATIFFVSTLFIQIVIYLYVKYTRFYRNIPKDDKGSTVICEGNPTPQVETLKENYKQQLERIRENCAQQMERIRESYLNQMQNLSDLRSYSSNQLGALRDNYYEQVQRVRDYSLSQLTKVRDNYVVQRKRLCQFGANQMDKLKEECKQQQQNINKLLENLPDNCATQRNNCAISIDGDDESNDDEDDLYQYNRTIQSQIEELTSPSKLLLPEIHEMLSRGGTIGGGGDGEDGKIQQEPTEISPLTTKDGNQSENTEHAV